MFTVKHEKSDGSSELFKAVRVQHIPAVDNGGTGNTAAVHFLCGPNEGGPGIATHEVNEGTVYVMNDSGKTVATYYLNAPGIPIRSNFRQRMDRETAGVDFGHS